jgi:hypothetical protein
MAGKWSAGEEGAATVFDALDEPSRPPTSIPAPKPASVRSAIRMTLSALIRAFVQNDQWH